VGENVEKGSSPPGMGTLNVVDGVLDNVGLGEGGKEGEEDGW
jgi:hypothetical protein